MQHIWEKKSTPMRTLSMPSGYAMQQVCCGKNEDSSYPHEGKYQIEKKQAISPTSQTVVFHHLANTKDTMEISEGNALADAATKAAAQ